MMCCQTSHVDCRKLRNQTIEHRLSGDAVPQMAIRITTSIMMASALFALLCRPATTRSIDTTDAGRPARGTQILPGAGNQAAADLSRQSPIIQSTYRFLVKQSQAIKDPKLRKATYDAIANPNTCIRHRASLTEADENRILRELIKQGLLDPQDEVTFGETLRTGVFPPVGDSGSPCPHLPQPVFSAPGSYFGGHHSYPGGLVIHEAKNLMSSLDLATQYRRLYGSGFAGLPTLRPGGNGRGNEGTSDLFIDQDLIVAAPIWHDWAKTIVFQWREDGSEFSELNFGGNGITDNNGGPGDSKTGAHHILGVAEAMARGLSPAYVLTQASAHASPSNGNEYKVVNWIRAAAIIAQLDPVKKGYLIQDQNGHLRLAPVRKLAEVNLPDLNHGQGNLLIEYSIHNLSDADATFSTPAVVTVDQILKDLAAQFGIDSLDQVTYNTKFRNPVLTFLTGERLDVIYSEQGIRGLKSQLDRLRRKKII